jgi:hypothetical protein
VLVSFVLWPPRYDARDEVLAKDKDGVSHIKIQGWTKRNNRWKRKLLVEGASILPLDLVPSSGLQAGVDVIVQGWQVVVTGSA